MALRSSTRQRLRNATTFRGFALLVAWALAAGGCSKSSVPGSPPSDGEEDMARDGVKEEPREASTKPKTPEKKDAGMAAQTGVLGVEPGMAHAQCLEVAKTRYELQNATATQIEVTGTWADLPVEMIWAFQDGKLTRVNARFLSYHGNVPIAETPIHKKLVELLGPSGDPVSKPRRESVSWSTGSSRFELIKGKTSSPGRGVQFQYWLYVSGAE
jgi:hypothetical protein